MAVAAVGLYVVWPSLRDTWAAAPTLADADAGWFLAMTVLQGASFVALWRLQQLVLDSDRLLPIATSQLASNALGKIVPGGGAAAVALQHRMLARGTRDPVRLGTGLTLVAVLTNGAVFLLPLAAVPTILSSATVEPSLVLAAWVGLGIALGLSLLTALLLRSRTALVGLARLTQWVMQRLLRRDVASLPERWIEERDLLLEFLGPRWLRAVLWTGLRTVLDYASLYAALAAVGAAPRAGLVVLAYVGAMVLASIPVTPGGLGFVEAGLTATITVAGAPAAAAATATLAYRLVSYWVPVLVGGPAYVVFVRSYGRPPPLRT
jgi:uncharacterized protein (TIRG00374 family)